MITNYTTNRCQQDDTGERPRWLYEGHVWRGSTRASSDDEKSKKRREQQVIHILKLNTEGKMHPSVREPYTKRDFLDTNEGVKTTMHTDKEDREKRKRYATRDDKM